MLYGFFDPTIIIVIPALLLTIYASNKLKSTYRKYSKINNVRGYSGAETARIILDKNGLHNIPIERVEGTLTDHYDPRKEVIKLSGEVYNGRSVVSVGVAAHEVGHAIQHAKAYKPLVFRNAIVPIASFGSNFGILIFIIGLIIPNLGRLTSIGIVLYSIMVFFTVITLPVEYNASSRALVQLESNGLVTNIEIGGVKKVLQAAALTYVAGALTGILQLIRMIYISRD